MLAWEEGYLCSSLWMGGYPVSVAGSGPCWLHCRFPCVLISKDLAVCFICSRRMRNLPDSAISFRFCWYSIRKVCVVCCPSDFASTSRSQWMCSELFLYVSMSISVWSFFSVLFNAEFKPSNGVLFWQLWQVFELTWKRSIVALCQWFLKSICVPYEWKEYSFSDWLLHKWKSLPSVNKMCWFASES